MSTVKTVVVSVVASIIITSGMLYLYHRYFNMVMVPNALAPGVDIRDLTKQNDEISGAALGKVIKLEKRVKILESK